MRPLVIFGTSLLLETAANAQRLGQGVDGGVSIWRVIVALIFCLALGAGGIFALRYRLGLQNTLAGFRIARSPGRLRLIETLRLGPQTALHLVDLDGRELLISSSAQGMSRIIVDDETAKIGATK